MFRRPARDRNYEFWGDQTFFGENPPGAAIISWFNKKQVGDVKLKITDAAGREVREISGTPLANSNKPGIQIGVLGSARAAQSGAAGCRRTRGAGRARQGGRRRTGRRRRAQDAERCGARAAGDESVRRRLSGRAGRRRRRIRRRRRT